MNRKAGTPSAPTGNGAAAETNATHAASESNRAITPATERQPWELFVLIGGTIAQSALILLGNTPSIAPWLLALLAAGIGQALLLPSTAAWLGGLAVVVLWVFLHRVTGIWLQAELAQRLLEIAGLGLLVALAIRYRKIWQRQQRELHELQELRQVLVAGEVGTGLLPREVGELRMLEEIDRARQFRRPLGLLLIEIEPISEPPEAVDLNELYRAITRQLISTALVHDVPFRVDDRHIGLIMPERDWDRLYADADSIAKALRQSSFLDQEGRPRPVLDYARLYFGLGTYQGEVKATIDLMRAAGDSLSISRDLAELGEAPVSAYAMPAAPVVEPKLVLWDQEE